MKQRESQGRPRDGTFLIAQKYKDMILYRYKALQQFPKSEKRTLAAEIKQSMLNICLGSGPDRFMEVGKCRYVR